MCLAIKYKGKFKGNKGWKLLHEERGRYYTGMCSARRLEIRTDRFTSTPESQNSVVYCRAASRDGKVQYEQAFHIFTRKIEAERLLGEIIRDDGEQVPVLAQVEFAGQVAWGETHWIYENGNTKTVVARELKLLEVKEA